MLRMKREEIMKNRGAQHQTKKDKFELYQTIPRPGPHLFALSFATQTTRNAQTQKNNPTEPHISTHRQKTTMRKHTNNWKNGRNNIVDSAKNEQMQMGK